MSPRHPFRRGFDDQHAARMARIRRARNVIALIVVTILLTALASGGWLLMHPEQIGTFIGRVAAGVQTAAGSRP
jgi:hypothetical protein